jgi:tetratricopeptide (TPR) repeat protein
MSGKHLINIALIVLLFLPACKHPEENQPGSEQIIPPSQDVPEKPAENPSLLADIESLQTSVQAAPEDASVRFQYVTALNRGGRYEDALQQVRELVAISGDNPFLGVAYLNFAGIVLDKIPADAPDRPALVNEAVEGMKIAVQKDPSSVPSHLALGRLALESGDDDTALHELSIALAATEIGYELRIRMAEIYIARRDREKARSHLDVARTLAQEAGDRAALRRINGLLRRAR